MLAHNVFFTLKDRSPEAKRALVEGCKAHLSDHPGTVFYACGLLEESMKRDVNDREFDVALHLIFESIAAHDTYQSAPRHDEFIAKFQGNWAKVRVFDSTVES